jgi:hypothetical protein
MDSIIWRHSEIERGVAARNADSRRKAKAGEVRRRLVARTSAAELNRFDELHASLCRNGVDAAVAVFHPLTLGREGMLAAAPASR